MLKRNIDQCGKREIRRMERARDMLMSVTADVRRGKIATPENCALVSSLICSVALLEHEIGRHMMAFRDDEEGG
jgi:hypothetical protein